MKLKNILIIAARLMVIIGTLYAGTIAVAALTGDLEKVFETTKNGIVIWVAAAFGITILYRIAEVYDDRESEKRD